MSTVEGTLVTPPEGQSNQYPPPVPVSSRCSGIKSILTELSPKQERAAVLVADDELSDRQIAKKLRINYTTLARWKKTNPQFRKRVLELTTALRHQIEDSFLEEGLARRGFRLKNLNDIHSRIRVVMDERAQQPELQKVPGGKTGIVVLTKKALGGGNNFEIIEESEIDVAMLRELRAIQKDAAEELGQLQPKTIMPLIHNGAGSAPVFQVVFKDSGNAAVSQGQ